MEPAPERIRFAADHFPAEANLDRTVVLTSPHSLIDVGEIPGDQSLTFQSQGLNFITIEKQQI